jgi:hypothetical protein
MRIVLGVLWCGLFSFCGGCFHDKEATAQQAAPYGISRIHPVTGADLVPDSSRSSVPGLTRTVVVEIDEIDEAPDVAAAARPGYRLLALKVRVENLEEKHRPKVDTDRFVIETVRGERFYPRRSDRMNPALPTGYVRQGTPVSGWLTFEIPMDGRSLILKSDLALPPVQIPVLLQ